MLNIEGATDSGSHSVCAIHLGLYHSRNFEDEKANPFFVASKHKNTFLLNLQLQEHRKTSKGSFQTDKAKKKKQKKKRFLEEA